MGRRTEARWASDSMRSVLWIVLVLLLAMLLILSGCGPKSGDTSSESEANTATEQPSEPDMAEQAKEESEARLDDLMAKVNERLDLSENQETQIRVIMQEYLLNMEEQMEARQAQFAGQNTPGSQRGSCPEEPRPEMTDEDREQMMGMGQKQQGQRESLNEEIQEILTPEQVEEFQKILDELRQEMILQQAIEQMGGENTSPEDK